MITAEKAIQNLQEVKEFCNAQKTCQSCPFIYLYNGLLCNTLLSMKSEDVKIILSELRRKIGNE